MRSLSKTPRPATRGWRSVRSTAPSALAVRRPGHRPPCVLTDQGSGGIALEEEGTGGISLSTSNGGATTGISLSTQASDTSGITLDNVGGEVLLPHLPTTDPSVTHALWNDNGTVVLSGSVAAGGLTVKTTSFSTNAYTLVLGDASSAQQASNGSTAATITVPANSGVAFPVGTLISITQTGVGKIQIAAAGGVTIQSSVSGGFSSGVTGCRAEYSTITLLKTATNTWVLAGDVA